MRNEKPRTVKRGASCGAGTVRGQRSSDLVLPDGTSACGRDDVRFATKRVDDVAPDPEQDGATPKTEERGPEGVVCCELHNVVPHRGPLSWER